MGLGHRPNSQSEDRPSAKYPWPSAVSVESSTVSVSRPSLPKVSALGLSAKSSRGLDLRSLEQIDWASGSQVGPSLARYRYTCPPGSRADVSDMSDESLIMGVGRSPLVARAFHFSRYDLTRRRDVTSDGAT